MKKKQRGVTIVELLVYIGLLSVFIIVLLDVFVSILNARLESQSTSTLDQDSRYILSKLNYDVTNADSVETPVGFGINSNSLTITRAGVPHTYSLDGNGNLGLNDGVETQKLNGSDTTVTNVSFTKLGNQSVTDNKPTVKISFTVKSLVVQKSGQQEQTVDTTLGLR